MKPLISSSANRYRKGRADEVSTAEIVIRRAPSVEKPCAKGRRRHHAGLTLAKPAIPAARHEIVDPVAQRTRHNDHRVRCRPREPQPTRDSQRRRRSRKHAAILDQHDAVGETTADPRGLDQPCSRRRLKRRKPKPRRRVALDDELHRAVTEVADAVKENHGRKLAGGRSGGVVNCSARHPFRRIHDRIHQLTNSPTTPKTACVRASLSWSSGSAGLNRTPESRAAATR